MFNFPLFGYPYNYRYYKPYNNYNQYIRQEQKKEQECETISPSLDETVPQNKKNSITNLPKISNTINSRSSSDSEQAIFEIFGIKIYLDDLIILGILFFLYQQNVKDEMLYIILLLLLFS